MNSKVKLRNGKGDKLGLEASLLLSEEALSLPVNEILSRSGTSLTGLSDEEVLRRTQIYGSNEVAAESKASIPIRFISHFKSPLTIILMVAAVISGVLGQIENTIIIFIIVLVSVVFDFFQEYRAERAAEALKKRVANTTATFRNGVKQDIGVADLVPGDVISLASGDIVPADARVIMARDLFADQSALTGESFPAEKVAEPVTDVKNADAAKWNNYLFMGTSVTNGVGTAVVVKTGSNTQYGEVVKKSTQKKPETEFEKGLRRFGYLIMQVTFVLVICVFLINSITNKHSILDSMLFSVALAVGLTPELLPMILSMNLAKGASAMSKKGVIVKRMASIQNFGSMDILCADKTGTLTENRVTVILHVDYEGKNSAKVLTYSFLNSRFQSGLRSPLDDAILKFEEIKTDTFTKVDEVPFDFVRRRLSVVVSGEGQTLLITKGAPEEVARVSSRYELDGKVYDLLESSRAGIEGKLRELSSQGFRLLGVAYRSFDAEKKNYSIADENDMVFLGFIAFVDPLKETAGESIELLRQAGVKLKILTGDNEIVAAKISQQVGFQVSKFTRGKRYEGSAGFVSTVEVEATNIVRGNEIENISDDALKHIVEKADIFTRVNPGQKNRIINALKANGHVVGFIGDGINDTPSMKVADVSISVANAVDIAKESAEIILLNNDLKVLRDGVIEGRKTFGNTMKYILMSISSNFGNMFSAAAASMFLSFLPMLPIQILLNNLLYSFAQLALPYDNVDQEYIKRPQTLVTGFVRNYMLYFGPISSIFDFLTFFVMLYVFHAGPALFQSAWFIESLFTQTLVIFAIRTRKSPFWKSRPSKILALNVGAVLLVAIILPFTPLGTVFGFVSLPLTFIMILIGFIIVYLAMVEGVKVWFFKRFGNST